jgi:anti-sigma regulatory factor (Ser/Thr protein kinase)
MKELEFELVADEKAPRLSRTRVEDLGNLLGSRSIDVKLVLSELVTNSVRHSLATETVRVRVMVTDDKIRLEVIDQGPGFPEAPTRGGGLGLSIVERLADEWGVSVDGTFTVWVEIGRTAAIDS